MARAAVKRGLRLSVGSWNTIWMRLRSGSLANSLAGIAPMSSPSKMMVPQVLIEQPHHHHRGRGLAAAGFADQADAFAALDREADAVDGAERLASRTLGPCGGTSFASVPSTPLRGYSLTRLSTTSSGARLVGRSFGIDGAGDGSAASSGSRSRSETPGRGVARISLRV